MSDVMTGIQAALREAVQVKLGRVREPGAPDVCPECRVVTCEGDCGAAHQPLLCGKDVIDPNTGEVTVVAVEAKKEDEMAKQEVRARGYVVKAIEEAELLAAKKLTVNSRNGGVIIANDGTERPVFLGNALAAAILAKANGVTVTSTKSRMLKRAWLTILQEEAVQ